jgi:hypothetical protein
MNGGSLVLLTLTFGLVMLLVQRAEASRRSIVLLFLVAMTVLVAWYANGSGVQREAFWGFILALVFNLLFWMFIGRYNPVGSSDNIRVLGMDD